MSKNNSDANDKSAKIFLVVMVVIVVGFVGMIALMSGGKGKNVLSGISDAGSDNGDSSVVSTNGEGKQVIDLTSKSGGYSPRIISAKSGIETILKVTSKNSYGCERSLRIPKLDLAENLPVNGQTEMNLGVQEAGSKLVGSCSMGMYTFVINFH